MITPPSSKPGPPFTPLLDQTDQLCPSVLPEPTRVASASNVAVDSAPVTVCGLQRNESTPPPPLTSPDGIHPLLVTGTPGGSAVTRLGAAAEPPVRVRIATTAT